MSNDVTLRFRADDGDAQRRIRDLEDRLRKLDRMDVDTRVDVDTKGAEAGLGRTTRAMQRADKASHGLRLRTVALGAALGTVGYNAAAGAIRGMVGALQTGFEGAQAEEAAMAQVAQTIKSTGGAAGVTEKQIRDLSYALQEQTGYSDDVIQNAQGLLLTFTKVGGDIFPQATSSILDMSRAMDQDLKTTTIQVGKALNDPIKGVSALQRVGVSFTAQQKEQIKAMAEAGDTAGAQAVILKELETQFGGQAKAYGETLPGQIEKLKRSYEDVMQVVAEGLTPVLLDTVRTVREHWPTVMEVGGEVRDYIKRELVPPIGAAMGALTGFWEDHGDDVKDVVGFIGRQIERIARTVGNVVKLVHGILTGDFDQAWEAAKGIVTDTIDGIRDAIVTLGPKVLKAAKTVGGNIARGIWNGFDEGLKRVPGSGAIRRILGFDSGPDPAAVRATIYGRGLAGNTGAGASSGAPRGPGLATGGVVPGPYTGRDDRLIAVGGGEVVLRPDQARMVGLPRILNVLAATGGRVGGFMFNRGGIVHPFPGMAAMGGGPAAHASRALGNWQSDDAWDLMGPAGAVVVAAMGGTIGRINMYDNPKPGLRGRSLYLNTRGGQLWYKHLDRILVKEGQAVTPGTPVATLSDGTGGGPHLHLGARPLSLGQQAIGGPRVPVGSLPGSGAGGDHAGHGDGEGRATPMDKALATFRAVGIGDKASKRTGGTTATRLARLTTTDTPDYSGGIATSPGGAAGRRINAAGRAAAIRARRERNEDGTLKNSPQQVAEAAKDAEDQETLRFFRRQIQLADRRLAQLRKQKRGVLRVIAAIRARKRGTKAARAAAIRRLRAELRGINREIREVLDVRAELADQLRELGEDIAQDAYQERYDAESDAGEGGQQDGQDPAALARAEEAADAERARSAVLEGRLGASGRILGGITDSRDIDPTGGVTSVTINIGGTLVTQQDVGGWLVGIMGNQPGSRRAVTSVG